MLGAVRRRLMALNVPESSRSFKLVRSPPARQVDEISGRVD
jgi:hypothetical protein